MDRRHHHPFFRPARLFLFAVVLSCAPTLRTPSVRLGAKRAGGDQSGRQEREPRFPAAGLLRHTLRPAHARLSAPAVRRGPARIQAGATAAGRHLEGLRTARRESDRKLRAGDLSEEDRLQALTTPLRDLSDAQRMIVHWAEMRLAAALLPGLSRPEAARMLVKGMLSSDASIGSDPSAETLTLQLLHKARSGHDLALASLLEELNRTRTLYPGTNLRLV